MTDAFSVALENRGLVSVAGEDARPFLQGLVSNDVFRATPDRAIWAALLTPQGKYLHDFFAVELDGALLLDCEAARCADLVRRLSLFKLRSKVSVTDRSSELSVFALYGSDALNRLGLPREAGSAVAFAHGIAFTDPRSAEAGARAIVPQGQAAELAAAGFEVGTLEDWHNLRIGLGLPDGSSDMTLEKAVLLENGFDELGGVDWEKGCYMGQELTARTKYRGLVKKRLVPVSVDGPLPAPGTPVRLDGRDVGEIRSGVASRALALLRLEALDAEGLLAGDARLSVAVPDWLARPE